MTFRLFDRDQDGTGFRPVRRSYDAPLFEQIHQAGSPCKTNSKLALQQ